MEYISPLNMRETTGYIMKIENVRNYWLYYEN